MIRKILLLTFSIMLIISFSVVATAHPGGTDENGGHIDQDTGEYHYHHGYPAHDHYDVDNDGQIDCPYDFDDQIEDGETGINKYVIAFIVSLGSVIIALLINLLAKYLEEEDRFPFLQKALFVVGVPFVIIAIYAASAIAVCVIAINLLISAISSIIAKYRIRKCGAYARTLLSIIEQPQFESCADDLLRIVKAAVHNRTKDFKPPFELMVQKTLFEASNSIIKSHIKATTYSHTDSYYRQMFNIRQRLGQILQIKDI